MSAPVAVAVVGVGYFGRLHARHYAANPAARLVAVVDIDEARARAVAAEFGAEPAGDHHGLRGRVVAASVVVPTAQHFQVARDLIASGIHVLVEKPITDSLESARLLAALADRQQRVLQVGHIERFSGTYRMLAKEVARPLYIESYRVSPWKQRAGEVDVVLDLMIHDIDIIQGLVGLPATGVHAVGTPVINPTADLANARIMFGPACVATITASRISYKSERRIRIFEPNRYIVGDFANHRVDSYTVSGDPMIDGVSAIRFDSVEIPKEDSLGNEIAEFLACIVSGRRPRVSGWDGCEALRVAKMVTDSMAEQRTRAEGALSRQPATAGHGRRIVVPASAGAPAAPVVRVAGGRCRVPLFDLSRQGERLGPRLAERVARVLEHGRFILGPEVAELEAALAHHADARHAVGVSSGRDALIMALMALGVGARDAVFVPAFTFSATAGAVVAAGGVPVFTDIDPATLSMSAAHLARTIDATLARGELHPKVVVPVDLYGLPADYAAIAAVAAKHGLTVVADAAQSFGATVGSRKVGTLAHATAVSFYPTKPLGGFGDGGAILTDDDDLADAVRQIRSHGTRGSGDVATRLGMTGRLDTLQAAVLLAKLEAFDESLAARRRLAARYEHALRGVVGTPHTPARLGSAWALYTVRTPRRETVRQQLAEAGIETGLYYRVPLHRHPAFAAYFTGEDALQVSEQVAGEVLSLPLHAGLADTDADRVIDAVVRAVQ